MKLIKISALILAMACASATDQNMLESDDRIVVYIRGSSEVADKSEPRTNFSEKYEREVAEPGRSIRAVTNDNSSERFEQNINMTSSGAFYFDYLVKDPQGKLHFHVQQKYENGTVKGFYGHGGDYDRYLVVEYVADAKGYRATVKKAESGGGQWVGLKAERIDGKIIVSFWEILSEAAAVKGLFTSGANSSKTEEDDDSYGSGDEE